MLVNGSNSVGKSPPSCQRLDGYDAADRPSSRRKRSFRSGPLFGVGRALEDLPGWWLAALLVLAPWAYGTTFTETKDWLAGALCGLGAAFLISLISRRRWPRINWWSALLSFSILAYGWWMTWNAKLVYDSRVFHFHLASPPAPWLAGTVDQASSWHQMLLITGLFCAFWVVSDFAASERWRKRLWLVVSLTGVSIALLGLVERVSAAPGIFWRTDLDCGPTFFATFRYHANAGAFINLIFPLVAAQCVCAFRKSSPECARAFWLVASLAVLVSAFVNVSRAAAVITVGLLAIFSARQLYDICSRRRHFSKLSVGIVAAIAIVGAGVLVWAVGFGGAYHRWTDPRYNIPTDARFLAYGAIEQHMLPKAGWWGFGPATFHLVFPFFTNSLGARIMGYWEQAHEDYLQCLAEWGFCGAGLWLLFFSNGIIRAGLTFWRRQRAWDGRGRIFAIACFLALASVLVHATVDFPMQIASLQLYTSVVLGFLASLPYTDSHRSRRFKAGRDGELAKQKERENDDQGTSQERKEWCA